MTVNRFARAVSRALAVAIVLVVSRAPATAQVEERADNLQLAVINADEVFVRAGAADSYYPFGKLRRGDVVRITGEKHRWARVVTAGPAFRDFFGYIRYPAGEAGLLRLEEGGRKGVALGRVRVLAPNLNTGYEPGDSWKRVLRLEPGREVIVIDTVSTERTVVHKIALPPDAEGWVSSVFLDEATPAQVAAWKSTAGRSASARPKAPPRERSASVPDRGAAAAVLARDEPMMPAVTTPEAVVVQAEAADRDQPDGAVDKPVPPVEPPPARIVDQTPAPGGVDEPDAGARTPEPVPAPPRAPVARRTAEQELADLETAQERLRNVPITAAEVEPLRNLYDDLAQRNADNKPVARYARARSEQLTIWAELQQRRAEITRLRKQVELTAEEADAVRRALDAKGLYVAVGRLSASIVFAGGVRPQLFRIQDPTTGRTIAYIRPDQDFDLWGMLDQLIGVVGRVHEDETLRLKIVEPKRIDLLAAETS